MQSLAPRVHDVTVVAVHRVEDRVLPIVDGQRIDT